MNEFKKYCEKLNEYYTKRYGITIVEMATKINFQPQIKTDGTPKLSNGVSKYKTSWEMNPKYNPLLFPNEGTYGYLFVDERGEIVNMGETQNANSRPNNYNCVSFNKDFQPLSQKSNGSTNIGKNILMAAGLKENKNYRLILVAFGECVNQFGERMIAPSQEKTMSKLYTEVTGKDKPLWNGKLKKLVAEYKNIFVYGQK
jgi:hypothetical protein